MTRLPILNSYWHRSVYRIGNPGNFIPCHREMLLPGFQGATRIAEVIPYLKFRTVQQGIDTKDKVDG